MTEPKPKPKTGAGAIPKRDKPLGSPVTVLDNQFIDSPATLALAACKSGYPMLVYLHILQKRQPAKATKADKKKYRRRFINERDITFSYEEAKRLGIGTRAFNLAIDRLHQLGFIDIVKPGHGLVKGECTIYGLSERWKSYGTPEFKAVHRAKVRYGFCAKSEKDSTTECSTCLQTGGGKFQGCLLPEQPTKIDGHCQRFERWI